MGSDMADSKQVMSRLAKLEDSVMTLNRAMVQVTEILIDQSQRIDHVSARIDALGERLDALGERLDGRLEQLDGRLERLIELQMRSFTEWAGRYQSHEERLSSLETRVDRLEK